MHARPLFYLLAGDVEQMSAHRQHTEIDTCHFLFTFSWMRQHYFVPVWLFSCSARRCFVRDIRDALVKTVHFSLGEVLIILPASVFAIADARLVTLRVSHVLTCPRMKRNCYRRVMIIRARLEVV
jgi:hypothetical protein